MKALSCFSLERYAFEKKLPVAGSVWLIIPATTVSRKQITIY